MTYREKLQSPEWQKMRLQIFQRDNFHCRHCGTGTVELHVHHSFYEFHRDPWDYPAESLITLCILCHECEENAKREFKASLIEVLSNGYTYRHLNDILSALLHPTGMHKDERIRAVNFIAFNDEVASDILEKMHEDAMSFLDRPKG